ncbi:hypothetical protein OG21DRAFT_562404 [Imleria badia]|nr:hypothetical protein OG21DRAFT_562404 [Imleria badia]
MSSINHSSSITFYVLLACSRGRPISIYTALLRIHAMYDNACSLSSPLQDKYGQSIFMTSLSLRYLCSEIMMPLKH